MLKKADIEKAVTKRFPEAIALIVSRDVSGKVNFCPVGFFSLIAWEPKIWAVGLYKSHYSTKIISATKEFVLCLPSVEQAKDVLTSGSVHGWNVDKTKLVSFQFRPSSVVKPPLIDNAIVCFECTVVEQTKVGDHTVFFGQIVAAHESGKDWIHKLYNWEDRRVGNLKLGDTSTKITFSPEGEKVKD